MAFFHRYPTRRRRSPLSLPLSSALPIAMLFSLPASTTGYGAIPRYNRSTQPARLPVAATDGPMLFIDNFLIEAFDNIKKTMHPPGRYEGNPVAGWREHTSQPYLTVVRDAEKERFRMWYNYDVGRGAAIAYAESKDGEHWEFPSLGILGEDNRVFPISHPHQAGYGAGVIDSGPDYPDREKRFKMAWWGQEEAYPENGRTPARGGPGMNIAFSPDGLHWRKYEENPVLPDFHEAWFAGDPRRPLGAGDIIDVYWDPLWRRFGAFLKTPAIPADGFSPAPRARNYIRRLVSYSESGDFLHWTAPRRVILPEPRDEGKLEFYGVGGTIRRGGLLIGFVRMLRDDRAATEGGPVDGVGYTALATSRDGLYWERQEGIFFDRASAPQDWDHAMTWIGDVVAVGDQNYIYYGGYKEGHKTGKYKERQLGLAKMRRDRFVSVDAASGKTGKLRTVGLYFTRPARPRLVLNADIRPGGSIRLEVKNFKGGVVPGFSLADCRPLLGEGLSLPVKWKSGKDLRDLRDLVFHLEFELREASLYGFELK